MRNLLIVCLLSSLIACKDKQYGIGMLNYEESQELEARKNIAAHGDKSRATTGSERKRGKFYRSAEYRQKRLKKRLKKR